MISFVGCSSDLAPFLCDGKIERFFCVDLPSSHSVCTLRLLKIIHNCQFPRQMDRLTNCIRADHRDLALCYRRIVDAADEDEQTRHQNQFTWELARHLVGEELVLFPAMQKNVRDDPVEGQRGGQHEDDHPHQQVST